MHDALLLSPHLLLTFGALLLLCLGAFARLRRGLQPVAAFFAAAALTASLAVYPAAAPDSPALAAFLGTGGLAAFFLPLLCGLGLAGLLFLGPYAGRRGMDRDEVYALYLLALLGGLLLAGGRSWLAFFLGLELLSLPLYVLIASRREGAAGAEAAIKYFVLGAAAIATLLFGIALVYAASGSLNIAAGLALPAAHGTALLGVGMILTGLGFKLSLAPFHLWTPDVYQGAPAPLAAFLASVVKAAAAAGLLRVLLALGPELWPAVEPVLWACAAVTVLAANLAALAQTSVKRMLGYSSAAHMGYLLLAALSLPAAGPGAAMYYAAALALLDLGAFGALAMLSDGKPGLDDADRLEDLRGLAGERPAAAGLLTLSLLGLAGMPPTAGFTAKLLMLRAALQGQHIWLAAVAVAGFALSIFYYLRVLAALWAKPAQAGRDRPAPNMFGLVAATLVALAVLVFGLAPTPVLTAAAHLTLP